MKTVRDSGRTTASANMTPMIDVVFLLIIFFLVSSHMAKQENRLPLDLPAASTHQVDNTMSNRMTININHEGHVQVGAVTVQLERLVSLLVQHQREHEGSAAVRIRTDKTVSYGIVEPLLRDIALAGIVDITFAVRDEK